MAFNTSTKDRLLTLIDDIEIISKYEGIIPSKTSAN